ncbi:MAG: O-methyltransferase [Niabella sp.]
MVYAPLQAAAKYFKYYIHAANSKGHGMHSPFVFEFITKVMNDFTPYEAYQKTETLRKKLLQDKTELNVEDFGAGSATTKSNTRTIAAIARNAAKSKKFGQLMYRMVNHYQPKTILELGTSLGITTTYLAAANPNATVITMEGADSIATIALQNFKELGLQNIQLIKGNFDTTLPELLKATPPIDFAFIDGNHRQEPTERYFTQLLPHLHENSLLVFDDIHWSEGMENAWKNIVAHDAVKAYIDLFYIGIISFKTAFKEKQEFVIRY